MKNSRLNKRGITFIEFLGLLTAIWILGALFGPFAIKSIDVAKEAEASVLLQNLLEAQQAYIMEHGEYATNPKQLTVRIPDLKWWTLNRFQHTNPSMYPEINPKFYVEMLSQNHGHELNRDHRIAGYLTENSQGQLDWKIVQLRPE